MIHTDNKKIDELLTRGVSEVIDADHLKKQLLGGQRLRIKFGIDPTGSDMHIGHSVPLRKLRQFQDLGHQAILLIGDYTATIGDPTGRDATRPLLSSEDVQENMKSYLDQAGKILRTDDLEVRYNSEWYAGPALKFFMELTGKVTVARVIDRDDFQKRLKEGQDIQMQELLYPLLQGYDSVALRADVEIGGTDQKFNLLMGRKIQKRYDMEEQDIMTLPILEGTDGTKKMSKSYDNYIALADSPRDMFGKVMSLPDALIIKYFELATDVGLDVIHTYKQELDSGTNPRDLKMKLAETLVAMYHADADAKDAGEYFVKTFSNKQVPDDMPTVRPKSQNLVDVLLEAGMVSSKSEARRAIEQGGVRINDEKVESIDAVIQPGDVVQKGKRHFVKIV